MSSSSAWISAGADGSNWLTYGRTYDEQRFSPLKQINAPNVSQLKLAWHYDLPTDPRAHESTPLIVDGKLYVTGTDGDLGKTGKESRCDVS
jgi:glucose dehydrogenase